MKILGNLFLLLCPFNIVKTIQRTPYSFNQITKSKFRRKKNAKNLLHAHLLIQLNSILIDHQIHILKKREM